LLLRRPARGSQPGAQAGRHALDGQGSVELGSRFIVERDGSVLCYGAQKGAKGRILRGPPCSISIANNDFRIRTMPNSARFGQRFHMIPTGPAASSRTGDRSGRIRGVAEDVHLAAAVDHDARRGYRQPVAPIAAGHARNQRCQAAIPPARDNPRHLVLRGRPRWFLAPSFPQIQEDRKPRRRCVVDASSIEVNRRRRRAKSDSLDAAKLVGMLIRWFNGEKKLWGVVNVPSAEEEARRQLHRELIVLKTQRTEHVNRIKGLLATVGLSIVVDVHLVESLDQLRQWDGSAVPPSLRERILREFERWQLVNTQIRALHTQRTQQIRDPETPQGDQVRLLLDLKGIGENGAWLLVHEFFGWRQIRNRRELASLAGLTPTPYNSGESQREQGISKAGNRRVRWIMVELAWCWLRFQPHSELSRWYDRRFDGGNARLRKVGIVALARKLLVALWKYLERGVVSMILACSRSQDWGPLQRIGVMRQRGRFGWYACGVSAAAQRR
jgi:transposase